MRNDILQDICQRTDSFIKAMPKELRKRYGQFFTSESTATFMSSLFSLEKLCGRATVSVLDAGCGSGILSAALVLRILGETSCKVALTLYETDSNVIPLLSENMESLRGASGGRLRYEIRTDNYILARASHFGGRTNLFESGTLEKYDLVIGNPPYKKVSCNAPEAKAMPEVCHGAPNLYFLFMAMGVNDMDNDGQMVYIIPRSWTSGAYFTRFRRYLFSNASITHIHLFESRDKVFDQESVLQETIIVKLDKTTRSPQYVRMTTSATSADFGQSTQFDVPTSAIIVGKERYVFLVTNKDDADLLTRMERMPHTLPELGMRMRTGLVVDFRSRDLLRNEKDTDTIPLFYSRHLCDGVVHFPMGMQDEYIKADRRGLMQRNKNYLFVKRFTSKEEHRRLQCGIYLKRNFPQYESISTQNKLNFIDSDNELSECVVFGLYVLFNPTAYDAYYRMLNGSTQVNSTEVNTMPVPTMNDIERIGKGLIRGKDLSESRCDEIMEQLLFNKAV